ncbi:MAG TPA: hypothetical protein VF273_04565 [Pelobium sp.]
MKKQFIALALAGLAFTACKKDSTTNTDTQLIKKIAEIEGGDTTYTNFSYDSNKKLVLVKTEDSELKLTYTGDNITTLENKDGEDKTKLEVTYEGGKPKSAVYTTYENNQLKETYKLSYTLDASNRVTEIIVKDNANANIVSKQVLTYTGANITKMQSYVGTNLLSTQELTYGTKKNPLAGIKINYVVDVFLADAVSANEVVKQKYTIGNTANETTNTYTYDGKGYPVKADVSEKTLPNGTPALSKLVFTY